MKRQIEDSDYVLMLRRFIRAAGRRFAESDPEGLALLSSLRQDLDEQISFAASSQLQNFSCSEISRALGVSKQAVHKRFSPRRPERLKREGGGA